MEPLTTSELELFHAGDAALFRRLVEGYSPRLLAMVRTYATDDDEAHDLLQEAWRRAFAKRETYSGSGTLLGWLYSVSRSVCLAAVERRASRDTLGRRHEALVPSGHADPHRLAEGEQLRRSIYSALMELPERERDVVILRMLYQLSTRETANAMGCAEGTVKAALHHALQKLRTAMEVWAL